MITHSEPFSIVVGTVFWLISFLGATDFSATLVRISGVFSTTFKLAVDSISLVSEGISALAPSVY